MGLRKLQLTLLVLFSTVHVTGSDVIGSHEPRLAVVGADIILPCHLEPPFNVTGQTVEWSKDGDVVHKYRSRGDNEDLLDGKVSGRTSLFPGEMHKGNISLKLSNVTRTDEGNYTCKLPRLNDGVKRGNVELIVDGREDKDPKMDNNHSDASKKILWIVGGVIGVTLLVAAVALHKKKKHKTGTNKTQRRSEGRPSGKPGGQKFTCQ